MPSPDVATYVGLDLVELDAQTLIDTALANLVETFPEWVPREGNTEVVLLEQLAAMLEDLGYSVNALPDGMTEVLLRLFGQTRDQGTPPIADVTFTLADTDGHTIPAGTVVRLDLGDDVDPVDFTTDADLVIPAGQNTGTVGAAAGEPTIAANGQPAGTPLELLDAISYVDTAALSTAAGGGTTAEDGTAFLTRTTPLLFRLTTTLVRPEDVEAYVAETLTGTVIRVKVLDLWNPDDVTSAPGRSPGFLTVAVATAGGGSLGTTGRDVLRAKLVNRMHAGLVVNVRDADVYTIDVALTVLRYANADPTATQAAVAAALAAYLNPDTWEWTSTVRINELIAVADAAAGVDTVLEVTQGIAGDPLAATDLALTGYAPLVKLGTVTVTVQDPA